MSSAKEIIARPDFQVEVLRTRRRKTATVKVTATAVTITVPRRTQRWEIEHIVDKKSPWIRQKLLQQATLPKPATRAFIDGEIFSYLGAQYRLSVLRGARRRVELRPEALLVTVPNRVQQVEDYVRRALIQWYKAQANAELPKKVATYSRQLDVTPRSVIAKTYKRRWGSCTLDGDIHFNWKLMLGRPTVIDYVVVHELCHLRHFNHSPAFWQLVARILPEYREQREWLRDYGHTLEI